MRGHGWLLTAGWHVPAGWWGKPAWENLAPRLPAELRERVATWVLHARRPEAEGARWTEPVERIGASWPAPKGLGALSAGLIELEVLDWSRFRNRRQVGSYTGLCPGEHPSGTRRRQGAISQHGNPRLRHALAEAAGRLAQWQPEYPALRALRGASGARARKRAIVAAARRLAIDLWRLRTGQCSAAQPKLTLR